MEPSELVGKVRETAARYGMFAPGQTVVVGVSGGPDSVTLLHVLAGLREEWELTLVAAHLNHGFRGQEAEEDAEYAAALAARLDIPCRSERVDVPALRRRQHLSAQEAARNARHGFLRRVAQEAGAERIALGHTRDDRVETVLLNLLRGSGLEGLSGFPPVALPLVRPLYAVRRAETAAYCAALALAPRHDSSNEKPDYRRNRVRAELLPHLASYYNARVEDAILRMADLASADNALLEQLAAEALDRCLLSRSERRLALDATALRHLPQALQRRLLRQAISQVRGHLGDVGFEPLERFLETVAAGQTVQSDLPYSGEEPVSMRGTASLVVIERRAAPAQPLGWECLLNVPGRIEWEPAGALVEAHLCASWGEAQAIAGKRVSPQAGRNNRFLFRTRDVAPPLMVRSWRPGDRFRPGGLGGSKKLQDLFTDRKIPAAERHRLPVVVDAGGCGRIIAAGWLQADESALSLAENPAKEADGEMLLLCLSAEFDATPAFRERNT